MMKISEQYRRLFEQQRGQKIKLEFDALEHEHSLNKANKKLKEHEQAKEIIRQVGLKTQQHLQFHISNIATLALGAVFEDPYELIADFLERRNKTECDLYFSRNEVKTSPMDASGGGTVDIAAFALRIASWTMQSPRTRNVIILDEPMKNLSPEYKEKGSLMIKEISKQLGIQFIIINHEPILTAHADKVFRVSISNKKSSVEEVVL